MIHLRDPSLFRRSCRMSRNIRRWRLRGCGEAGRKEGWKEEEGEGSLGDTSKPKERFTQRNWQEVIHDPQQEPDRLNTNKNSHILHIQTDADMQWHTDIIVHILVWNKDGHLSVEVEGGIETNRKQTDSYPKAPASLFPLIILGNFI